ncbi:bifunctional enoyl-CoA hydratase/phosphate acetyltransferase [Abyssisolibacter fermentans]|uniref:bifunctional enoyl-CoA hydratase/phosphate acetyltransferase n=1 Tax=Abyssisolibacter fermentans TaxID=1766203 RepID=UPI00083547FD|nr:bifunctional enoyl-CoA hydratase/phosphate acetyltransferase [Abyssisolibacter fermentans]
MIKNFDELIKKVSKIKPSVVSVAVAEDEAVMTAVRDAARLGFIEPILVGNQEKIDEIANKIEFTNYKVIDCHNEEESIKTAVKLVRDGNAKILMKGLVNTATYMRGVLNRDYGLRTGRLLSLLAVYELPQYHKLIYCTDSGINVSPDLSQKKDIMTNVLLAMKNLGFENPKTAILTANEMVNPKVKSTVDAKDLVDMVDKGEIPSCIAEGPIAFDVAFDAYAAKHKGIDSKIAGDVDLLVFPNIETGNVLGKSWLKFNDAKWAGIVLGAKAPVILGSRSDTPEIKINSIALACLSADE